MRAMPIGQRVRTRLAAGAAAAWPRFSGTSQQVLSLVPPQPQPETDFSAEHHCAFWAPEP